MDDIFEILFNKIDNMYSFISNYIFNKEEEEQLIETIYNIITEIINEDRMIYIKPNFHDIVYEQAYDLLKCQLEDINSSVLLNDYIDIKIKECIEYAFTKYYKNVSPKRSYVEEYDTINKKEESEITKLKDTIDYLQNIKQPQQRTDEWYEFRNNVITASNIFNLFKTKQSLSTFIYEKCNNDIEKCKASNYSIDISTPMGWGQLFEKVSVQYYENKYNTKVGEFGCIPHKKYNFLAASPDGINIKEDNSKYGRMLEIKNITNREINGIPKMEYWIQTQIQMEVCDLDECDFLETQFKEYESENEFYEDFDKSSYEKGIILYLNDNGKSTFEYSDWGMNAEQLKIWEEETLCKLNNMEYVRSVYWKLEKISCVVIPRNKLWFEDAIIIIEETWNNIVKERENGEYVKRKTNRKTRSSKDETKNVCLIDTSVFNNSNNDGKYACDTNNETNIYNYIGCKENEYDFIYLDNAAYIDMI